MSRDAGFPTADIDTGMLDDTKFRALWRRLADQAAMCQATTVFQAVLLESWASGERVTAGDAAPVWLTPPDDVIAALIDVGLLDNETRIPEKSWEAWFGPARDRRTAKKAGGRRGGLAAHGIPAADPDASSEGSSEHSSEQSPKQSPEHSPRNAPTRPDPSIPSIPSIPSGRPRRRPRNGHDDTTCPGCGDELHPADGGVVARPPDGQLWHKTCPTPGIAT